MLVGTGSVLAKTWSAGVVSATAVNQSERDQLVNLLIESRDQVVVSSEQLSVAQWAFRYFCMHIVLEFYLNLKVILPL